MNRNVLKGTIVMMLVLLLVACSQNSNNDEPSPNDQTSSETIILYYSDDDLMDVYKVKADIEVEADQTSEQVAIDAWLDGPEEPGLRQLLPAGTTAQFLRSEDEVAHVSFSEHIREATVGSGGEAAIVTQITMLMKQFGHAKTQILVDEQIVTELLGHMTYDKPIEAENEADFEWYTAE